MHTREELIEKQALPLSLKIRMTQNRIRAWVDYFGKDGVYVSFSGGKDSTVLLDIVRKDFPDIPAVFIDTGLEYPEIREFVKTYDNVTWLKPNMNFKQVINKYGYPFISKEVSNKVYEAKKYLQGLADNDIKYAAAFADLVGCDRRVNKDNELYRQIKNGDLQVPIRVEQLVGTFKNNDGEISNQYDLSKWAFLLDAPFDVSHKCCNVMKKAPAHKYASRTKRAPITAQMASESRLRTQKWLQNGCNAFDSKNPISNPMSFWTEQDVLQYIKDHNLPICSVYGQVVEYGQYDLFKEPQLKTTGCSRTGCMFCGFGCHLEKPGEGRFELMKETHPAQYDYIMRPTDGGGLNYKEIITWLNENGNLNIRY